MTQHAERTRTIKYVLAESSRWLLHRRRDTRKINIQTYRDAGLCDPLMEWFTSTTKERWFCVRKGREDFQYFIAIVFGFEFHFQVEIAGDCRACRTVQRIVGRASVDIIHMDSYNKPVPSLILQPLDLLKLERSFWIVPYLLRGILIVSHYIHTFLFFSVSLLITVTFQLNSQGVLPSAISWTSRGHRCRPFPPVRAFNFYRAKGSFSIPTARRFSSNVADSCSRAFR